MAEGNQRTIVDVARDTFGEITEWADRDLASADLAKFREASCRFYKRDLPALDRGEVRPLILREHLAWSPMSAGFSRLPFTYAQSFALQQLLYCDSVVIEDPMLSEWEFDVGNGLRELAELAPLIEKEWVLTTPFVGRIGLGWGDFFGETKKPETERSPLQESLYTLGRKLDFNDLLADYPDEETAWLVENDPDEPLEMAVSQLVASVDIAEARGRAFQLYFPHRFYENAVPWLDALPTFAPSSTVRSLPRAADVESHDREQRRREEKRERPVLREVLHVKLPGLERLSIDAVAALRKDEGVFAEWRCCLREVSAAVPDGADTSDLQEHLQACARRVTGAIKKDPILARASRCFRDFAMTTWAYVPADLTFSTTHGLAATGTAGAGSILAREGLDHLKKWRAQRELGSAINVLCFTPSHPA